MHRLLKLFVLAMALLGIMATMTPANADPAINFSNDSVQPIIGTGSDTTIFVMNSLSKAFNESEGCIQNDVKYPTVVADPDQNTCRAPAAQPADVVKTENYDHDVAYSYYPQGSNAGRRQLCEQTTPRPQGVVFMTYARSSSAPDVGFQCPAATGITLRFVAFAKDALTWTYWTGQSPAPSTNLTQSQLNDIFVDCTITNWNQLGGENAPIEVWTAIPGSGSRSSWDTFLGGSTDSCIPAALKDGNFANGERVIREHNVIPVETEVAGPDEKYSIFFVGVGTWNAQPGFRGDSLLGSVEGFAPDETNIQTGDFPFSRFMYNVLRQSGPAPLTPPATANFVGNNGWICKPAGQHSKPIGDPGLGQASGRASINYHEKVLTTIRNDGFIPIRETGNKCDVIDWVSPV